MGQTHDEIVDYWNDYAHAYDDEPDHGLADPATREAWRALLESWLPAHSSDVVDLACGTGSLTALASGLGHRVAGVDLAGNMVDLVEAIEPLVHQIQVVPLTDPVLWGKDIPDERYLLVADLRGVYLGGPGFGVPADTQEY
jgi:SAM-dependent methyltransferase